MQTTAGQIARQVSELKVLIVDDELSMRKVTRALL
jgi:two-component system, chemotaxis family, chemotaxis protein CheY